MKLLLALLLLAAGTLWGLHPVIHLDSAPVVGGVESRQGILTIQGSESRLLVECLDKAPYDGGVYYLGLYNGQKMLCWPEEPTDGGTR